MNEMFLILCMIFFHIVDDYYLQGFLASAKQKKWWENNCPDKLYKNDYIMALFEHAFSWTFMIHIPVIIYLIICGIHLNACNFLFTFILNLLIHAIVAHIKANLLKINLIEDQLAHMSQIFITWLFYIF